MNDKELDAEFERIVAGWDDEAPDPGKRDLGDPPSTSKEADGSPGTAGAGPPAEARSPGTPPPPGAEDRPTRDVTTSGITLPIAPTTRHVWRGPTAPSEPDRAGPASRDDDGDEGHFVPPAVTDLPSTEDDPMYWAIVVGLAGGPLLLLYLLIFDREGSGWWIVTAVAMTVVGFVLLVLRGGSDRDPFDDGTRL